MTPAVKKAEYIDQVITEFENNPFIEALPPLSDFRTLGAQLTVRPPYSNAERSLPDEVRLMLTQRIVQFHQPSDIDIDLASRLARCIRWGYINRNPFSGAYAAHLADGYVEAAAGAGINYSGSYHPNSPGYMAMMTLSAPGSSRRRLYEYLYKTTSFFPYPLSG